VFVSFTVSDEHAAVAKLLAVGTACANMCRYLLRKELFAATIGAQNKLSHPSLLLLLKKLERASGSLVVFRLFPSPNIPLHLHRVRSFWFFKMRKKGGKVLYADSKHFLYGDFKGLV
jgi:hypothetical protein